MNRAFGWKPDNRDERDFCLSVAVPSTLPTAVDLRPGMPAPYDQGELGACTAHAWARLIEFDLKKQGLTEFMPSRLWIYYQERLIEGTVDQDAGAELRDGAKAISKVGVPPETLWPYQPARFAHKPTVAAGRAARLHKAVKYMAVSQSLKVLKATLASGYPVAFGFTVYEAFESDEVARSGVLPMPRPGEPEAGGHAVVLSGFDDARQAFLVANSWGEAWGEGGYFWMPYGYVCDSRLSSDFWTLEVMSG